eukprot:SAG31_NODE_932_length_10913_cov_3.933235_11_plen_76_part_00
MFYCCANRLSESLCHINLFTLIQVHVGELVEATILVERLRPTHTGSMIVFCATNCATEQAGQVISGEARVLVPTS